MNTAQAGLYVDQLTVTWRNGHTALRDASFSVPRGSIAALGGVNGSGKSTLFKALMGFVRVGHGEIAILGQPVNRALRQNLVAYVPQSEEVDWSFPVLVEDVVMMGRYGHMGWLLEPFGYHYMLNAMWVSALVGGVCAFLSCYLMLKGWSLIGDALSHSIVPGVAGAYMLGLPFALGAFLSGGLAAGSMLFLQQRSRLKEDAIIGLIFSSFFGIGLFMVSLNPTSVNIQTIILGNILAIAPEDIIQLAAIGFISMAILLLKWKDLMVTFFDEHHARSIGLNTRGLKLLFFTLLAACTVAALQTVGAFLVICLVVTPGATAWLLTDRFPRLLAIAVSIGSLTSFFGAWLSYYLDGATGGIIVVAQTLLFLITFIFAPKHGLLASRRRAREAAC